MSYRNKNNHKNSVRTAFFFFYILSVTGCLIEALRYIKSYTPSPILAQCYISYRNQSFVLQCRPQSATLLKKRFCSRCFPVNFAKFPRTPFFRTPPGYCFCGLVQMNIIVCIGVSTPLKNTTPSFLPSPSPPSP